ncbi:MAG: hypothetical protein ACLTMP_06310 [Eggerthella lenta]
MPYSAPASYHIDELCCRDANTVVFAEVTDDEAAESAIGAENKRRIEAAYDVSKATDVHGTCSPSSACPCLSPSITSDRGRRELRAVRSTVMEMGGAFADGTPYWRSASIS